MPASPSTIAESMIVIPSGRLRMGADNGYLEEAPVHDVVVPSFAMDRHLVTNAQFKEFCHLTGRAFPQSPRWEHLPDSFNICPDHPVVNVSFEDAAAYAEWRGKRLPTEAEWEYAARGGLQDARYPWGDAEPGSDRAQYATRDSSYQWRDWRHSTGYRYTAPVGLFPTNAYGLYDMAGNVWEWCQGWFYEYPDQTIDSNQADGWGLQRVLRGGSFYSPIFDLRVSRRLRVFGSGGGNGMGFRCVMDVGLLERPANPNPAPRTGRAQQWPQITGMPGVSRVEDVQLCVGMSASIDDDQTSRARSAGFTSIEQYVTWETVENEAEGQFDFSHWDKQVDILKRHKLKWVPFLISGPAYSLPDWYRRSDSFHGLECLEHGLESGIQSIWDPRVERHVDRFIGAFAERYRDAEVIESLLLGISGDFGEAIYPVTGTTWPTVIPGPYHTHSGFWCGDRYARSDFRNWATATFDDDLDALNKAWGTDVKDPAAIEFPPLYVDPIQGFRVDEPTDAGVFPTSTAQARRRWLDFVGWYRDSMNRHAERWLRITRRHVRKTPIYLCTGGHAQASQGSHFGQQCRIAAAYDAGVRITNEASNYANNFAVTQWVASAGRHYGAYVGFEPAGRVDEKGVTARIFNAAVSGAKNLHFYAGNVSGNQRVVDSWTANYDKITVGDPVIEVAVLYPDQAFTLGEFGFSDFVARLAPLRDAVDVAFVDDDMIATGALARYRAIVVLGGIHYPVETITTIQSWLEADGLLAVCGTPTVATTEGTDLTESLISSGAMWLNEIGPTAAEKIVTWLRRHDVHVPDGVVDHVYMTQLAELIMILNHNDDAVHGVSVDGEAPPTTLPPNSITLVPT